MEGGGRVGFSRLVGSNSLFKKQTWFFWRLNEDWMTSKTEAFGCFIEHGFTIISGGAQRMRVFAQFLVLQHFINFFFGFFKDYFHRKKRLFYIN